MRQVHHAGETRFVDYAGKKPRFIDPGTGGVVEVDPFVSVLGASNTGWGRASENYST